MIRIVLVASAVILFLVFAVPVMLILERKGKSDPRAAEWRSLRIVQGMFRFILKLAGVTYEVHGLENIPMDRAVLYVGNHRSYFDGGLCDGSGTYRLCSQKGDAAVSVSAGLDAAGELCVFG